MRGVRSARFYQYVCISPCNKICCDQTFTFSTILAANNDCEWHLECILHPAVSWHYDLHIQTLITGSIASWAVAKSPPLSFYLLSEPCASCAGRCVQSSSLSS